MCIRSTQLNPVGKVSLEGHVIPLTHLFLIQVINKIGTPPLACQFITRSLHISIRQAESLPGPAKPRAWLHVRSGKFSRVAQTPYRHGASYLSVTFPEQPPLWQFVLLAHEKKFLCSLRFWRTARRETEIPSTRIRNPGN